ncbi:MAG: hypothetical protein WBO45_18780 [Planctomycetota bacterium]
MTEDEWAPLPAVELCRQPGERAEVAPRRAPRAAAPSPPEPDPAAQRLLADLQARLAKATPATNWLAEARRREDKERRQLRAAGAPELAATAVTGSDPTATPVVHYDRGPDGRDGREDSDWFRALPAAEQQRLHAVWATERGRFTNQGALFAVRMRRALAHGALVMGALGVLQSLLLGGFGLVPAMAFAGAVAAAGAELCRGDRFVYALAGGLAWVVVMGPLVPGNPFVLYGLLMAAYGMGAIGMEGEMRRSGGFPDR